MKGKNVISCVRNFAKIKKTPITMIQMMKSGVFGMVFWNLLNIPNASMTHTMIMPN